MTASGAWRIVRAADGRPKVDAPAAATLLAAVEQLPRRHGLAFSSWTCASLAQHLVRSCHPAVSRETIRRQLHRLGYRIVRPVLHVRSPDPDFLSKAAHLSRCVMAAEAGQVNLLFADEVDLHLVPGVLGCWTKRGRQRKVDTPGQNQKRYGFGAVDWMTGALIRHVAARKNSQAFCQLIDLICQHYHASGSCAQVILVLDNYGIHHSAQTRARLEREASWLTICWLPTYAPQLNPIEQLWKCLRRRVTHNQLFASIDAVVAAVDDFFNQLDATPANVLSVIGHSG